VLGTWQPVVVAGLAAAHLLGDIIQRATLSRFAAQQAVHLVVVAGLASTFPAAINAGWGTLPTADLNPYLAALTLISGLIVNLEMGGIVIGSAMQQFRDQIDHDLIVGLARGSL